MPQPLWKIIGRFLQMLNTMISCDLVMPCLNIQLKVKRLKRMCTLRKREQNWQNIYLLLLSMPNLTPSRRYYPVDLYDVTP